MLQRGPQRPQLQLAPTALFALALKALNVTRAFIRKRKRTDEYVGPRRAMVFLLYSHGLSYPQIGELLERDHSSIIHLHRQAMRKYKAGTDSLTELTERFDALVAKQIDPTQESLWNGVA